MRKSGTLSLLIAAGLFMLAAGTAGGGTMKLSSSAFKDGEKIPIKYVMPGAGGQNVSVPLAWEGPPPGTQSFALSVVDPHPVAHNWVHWLVINLPASAHTLAPGASGQQLPARAVELRNSFGQTGYGGPQPPPGSGDHPYVFTLYALSVPRLDLPPGTSLGAFKQALGGKVLGQASLTGYYGR